MPRASPAGKVFKLLGFQLSNAEIEDLVACKPLSVEGVLKTMRKHVRCRDRAATFRAAASHGGDPWVTRAARV